jgi:hypothetical protein
MLARDERCGFECLDLDRIQPGYGYSPDMIAKFAVLGMLLLLIVPMLIGIRRVRNLPRTPPEDDSEA